jgi:hypothetical protein
MDVPKCRSISSSRSKKDQPRRPARILPIVVVPTQLTPTRLTRNSASISRRQPEPGTGGPVRTGRHRSSGSHATTTKEVQSRSLAARGEPQHFLNFFPLLQGKAALHPPWLLAPIPQVPQPPLPAWCQDAGQGAALRPRSTPSRPRAPRRPRHPDLPAPVCGTRSWAMAGASTAWSAARVLGPRGGGLFPGKRSAAAPRSRPGPLRPASRIPGAGVPRLCRSSWACRPENRGRPPSQSSRSPQRGSAASHEWKSSSASSVSPTRRAGSRLARLPARAALTAAAAARRASPACRVQAWDAGPVAWAGRSSNTGWSAADWRTAQCGGQPFQAGRGLPACPGLAPEQVVCLAQHQRVRAAELPDLMLDRQLGGADLVLDVLAASLGERPLQRALAAVGEEPAECAAQFAAAAAGPGTDQSSSARAGRSVIAVSRRSQSRASSSRGVLGPGPAARSIGSRQASTSSPCSRRTATISPASAVLSAAASSPASGLPSSASCLRRVAGDGYLSQSRMSSFSQAHDAASSRPAVAAARWQLADLLLRRETVDGEASYHLLDWPGSRRLYRTCAARAGRRQAAARCRLARSWARRPGWRKNAHCESPGPGVG